MVRVGRTSPGGFDPMTVTVLVADDQDLVRTGLRVILDAQPGIEVIADRLNF